LFHFQFFILVRHLRRPGPSWKFSPLAKCKIFIQISKPPRVRCRYVPKAGSYWDESKRENVQYHTGFPAQVKRFGRRMISASRRDALDSLCTGLCDRDRTAGRPSLPKGRYPLKPSSAVAQQHVASQPRGNGPARGSFSHTEIRIRSCFRTMEPPFPFGGISSGFGAPLCALSFGRRTRWFLMQQAGQVSPQAETTLKRQGCLFVVQCLELLRTDKDEKHDGFESCSTRADSRRSSHGISRGMNLDGPPARRLSANYPKRDMCCPFSRTSICATNKVPAG